MHITPRQRGTQRERQRKTQRVRQKGVRGWAETSCPLRLLPLLLTSCLHGQRHRRLFFYFHFYSARGESVCVCVGGEGLGGIVVRIRYRRHTRYRDRSRVLEGTPVVVTTPLLITDIYHCSFPSTIMHIHSHTHAEVSVSNALILSDILSYDISDNGRGRMEGREKIGIMRLLE